MKLQGPMSIGDYQNKVAGGQSIEQPMTGGISQDVGSSLSQFGQQQNGLNQQQNGFGQQQNDFGQQQNGFGQQQNGLNQQQNGFGQQQNGFGQQQNGLNQQQNGLNQQQNGFGQQQNGLNQQQNGFGQQQNGFGQQQNGLNQQQNGFGQQQNGFGQQQNGFGQQQNGFGQQQNGLNQQQNGMNQQQNGMNQQQNGMNGRSSGGSGVVLNKGQKVSFSQYAQGINEIQVGLGWDCGNYSIDLDASCFLLQQDGRVQDDRWMIFYNQPQSPDGSVCHMGDNATGIGDGDDEVIQIRLQQLPPNIVKIALTITMSTENVTFDNVSNAYLRVVDRNTNSELFRYHVSGAGAVRSLVVAEIYKHNGEWKINPVGAGYHQELADFCGLYGVNLA